MNSKDYFDQVASEWDQLQAKFFSTTIREKAFALAKVKEGELAADIGAGSGYITTGLLEKGLKVIAVDQSHAMLDMMRAKFKSNPNIEYRQGDVLQLPIADATIDYVFANMLLHHLPDPLKGIREMVRILKPGGKVVITDLDKHNMAFLRHEHHDYWLGFNRDDIRGWFIKGTLTDILIDSTGEQCRSESCTSDQSASISIFIAIGKKL